MIKKIRSWGGSKGILLSKEDCELWDLKDGDVVDITIEKQVDWKEMRMRVASNN